TQVCSVRSWTPWRMSSRMSAIGWRRSIRPPRPSATPEGISAAASARETSLSRIASVPQLVAAEEGVRPRVDVGHDDRLDQRRPLRGERRGDRLTQRHRRGDPDAIEPGGAGNRRIVDVAEVDPDGSALEVDDLLLADVAVAVIVHHHDADRQSF